MLSPVAKTFLFIAVPAFFSAILYDVNNAATATGAVFFIWALAGLIFAPVVYWAFEK